MTSTIKRLRYAVKTFKGIENKVLISVSDLDLLLALVDAVEYAEVRMTGFNFTPDTIDPILIAIAKLKEANHDAD